MPYITREDGERFIIPSYRDTLSAKKVSLLKREITLLSSNYGEYITLQKKNVDQYEVAFSPDPGYLLGECVWQHFKRPFDMIYCEAIPNTNEAILVIVKSGSVYLDGSFPLDSIPEELVIFKTQQNNFNIYIHGDVPISQNPEAGKFYFETSSVKSFTILDAPVFPTLPTVKVFQLQLVDIVLKAHGIGVFPVKQLVIGLTALTLLWMAWWYVSTHKKELPSVIISAVNPYQVYISELTSPDPVKELSEVVSKIALIGTIPGWFPDMFNYTSTPITGTGTIRTPVKSKGSRTTLLYAWAAKNFARVEILPEGFFVTVPVSTPRRSPPVTIYRLQEVISTLIDRVSYVYPGNHLKMSPILDRKAYSETEMTIDVSNATPVMLLMLGEQLRDLPLVLTKVNLNENNHLYTGTITFKALGN